MSPAAIERLAASFWEQVGEVPPPPRDLEPWIPILAGPVFLATLEKLSPRSIRDWFSARPGLPLPPVAVHERDMLGCVIAYRDCCGIFINAALPPPLRRVIVAHEFAHFLAEYYWPRRRVFRRFGPSLRPVLDGERPPSDAERWAATMAGVSLGIHAHFLERAYHPAEQQPHFHAELRANALALELLAPKTELLQEGDFAFDWQCYYQVLIHRYDLPETWAAGYARELAAAAVRTLPCSRRWGL